MQSPKDKMIKNTKRPAKKKTTKKKDKKETKVVEAEVVNTEPEKELSVQEEKELQVIGNHLVAPGEVFNKLTRSQINLIKRTVAKGATDDELKLFISVCQGAQLNPFLRQAHFVKRWDSKEGKEIGVTQVGIDGFRAIAESGGQYAGSDDAVYRDEHEKEVKDKKVKVPGQATVTVYKLMDGQRYPFTATARWSEYCPPPKQASMWQKMPYNQLAKCAEALALRKAFPKLLSGLYAPEEMDQAQPATPVDGNDVFMKVKMMIKKSKDIKGLEELTAKINESDKYTDKEKKELIQIINERLEILYADSKKLS